MSSNLNLKLVLVADNTKLVSGVNQSADSVKKLDTTIDAAGKSARDMGAQTQAAGANARDGLRVVHAPAQQATQHINDATMASQSFGSNTASSSSQAASGLDRVQRSGDNVNTTLRTMAKAAAGAFVALQIGNQLSQMAEQLSAYQDMRTRLTELSGSAQAYGENEQYLIDLSDTHHKNLLVLANSYSRILTLEKAGLTTRAQARQLLEGLSNASSALGASSANLEQSLYGIAQGMSAGILRAEELNQVTEPLPGLLQELDKAAGVASGGFRKMVNDGKVTSDMFRDTLITALAAYNGASERTANNLTAKYADLETARIKMAAAFEQPINDSLGSVLDGTTAAIDFMSENADELITTLEVLATVLGARVVVALGAVTQAKLAEVVATRAKITADLQAAVAAEKLAKADLLAAQAAAQKAQRVTAASVASVAAARNMEAATRQLSRAEAAHAATLTTVATAAQRANIASRALAGGMALLGGPLGLLITAGSALAIFAINSSEASEKAGVLDGSIASLANSYRDLNAAQLELKLVDLDDDIAKLKIIQEGQTAGLNTFQAQVNGGAAIFQSAVNDQAKIVKDSNAELDAAVQLRQDIMARINELKNPAPSGPTDSPSTTLNNNKDELAALESSLYTQEQTIAAAYLRRQAIIDTALENKQISEARYDELSLQNSLKNGEDLVKLANQNRQNALTQQRAQEIAEAQGFQSIVEQQEASHQDRLKQIREQKKQAALQQQRQAELIAIQGFDSQEEYQAALHQQRLADLKERIALDAVRSRREKELLETAGYHSRAEAEEAQHQKRLVDIQKQKEKESMDAKYTAAGTTAEIFGNLSQVMAEGSKKDFENSKRLAIVQATINGAIAATKAFAQGGILGPVLAVSIAALTAMQIGKIKSQEYQGIAHGGMTNVPAESTYLLQKGERVLSPNQNQDFTRYIQNQPAANDSSNTAAQAAASPTVVQVTFKIETNDAASFNSNLVRSSKTIESIIKSAMSSNAGRL
ncbi:MAG: tape measure protein [Marinomonas sp.]|uniref:tape measure protein n=1 Tax=Marinomonas sp. TaxID=1904862 RepID=UPI003F9E2E11